MTVSLTTQLQRSLFALPLLAIAALAPLGIETAPDDTPAAATPVSIVALGGGGGGDTLAFAGEADCGAPSPAGPRALGRMPGDLGPLAARIRCAQ